MTAQIISEQQWVARLKAKTEAASADSDKPSFGGGSGGGMSTEERVAKIEATIEGTDRRLANIETDVREMRRDLRTDFRVLFGSLISAVLALAALMAKGFHWL